MAGGFLTFLLQMRGNLVQDLSSHESPVDTADLPEALAGKVHATFLELVFFHFLDTRP